MSAIKLIAGLGNPGQKYAQTRHNAGFALVDELARRYSATFAADRKFHGEVARVNIDGHDVRLLKPATFMNLSGQAVQAAASFYRIAPDEILVAHDELDLPPGVVRLKRAGGHGGHNGLRHIIEHIGKEFWRVRLGIGHPGDSKQVISFVLKRAPATEVNLLNNAIDDVAAEIANIVGGQMEKSMQVLHTRSQPAK